MRKVTVVHTVAMVLSLLLVATLVVYVGTNSDHLPSSLLAATVETLRKSSSTSRSLASLVDDERDVLVISSIKELASLQGVSNHDITLRPGVYVIDSSTKSSLPGGNWIVDQNTRSTGILNFSGNNNIWRFRGVEIQFNTEVLDELPNLRNIQLVRIGGSNNVFEHLKWTHTAKANGQYGSVISISGAVTFLHTGTNNKVNYLELLSAGGRPYGFGSMMGKTGSGRGMFPGSRLGKQSAYLITGTDGAVLQNSHIDGSGFGHVLFFQNEAKGIVIENCLIEGETRSTDDLRENGIDGYDRNGVPFNMRFNGMEYGAALGNGEAYLKEVFKPLPGTDACQSLDSGFQSNYVRPGYQFSLVEGGLRSYGSVEVTVLNSTVRGVREGLSAGYSEWPANMRGVSFRGLAGHGVPACDGAWNSNTPDSDAPAIQPSSSSTITRCKADAPFSTALEIQKNKNHILVDLEILDPVDGRYARPLGEALATIDGTNHAVRLEKTDEQPLTMLLKVKVGSKGTTSNLLLCNLNKQPVELSSAVSNSVVYSIGPVSNKGSGNKVVILNNNSDEPDVCKDVRDGKRPPKDLSGLKGPAFLTYNAMVHISGSKNAVPNTRGTMNSYQNLEFGSGSAAPSIFVVRHEPSAGDSDNECVQWNDKIWLAISTESHNTSNCGWYGCRVARMSDVLAMEFGHGRSGQSFYVRPRSGASSSSGCVSYGDEVFLAFSSQPQKTLKCGWYGCRVLHYRLGIFGRGSLAQQAGGIYFSDPQIPQKDLPGLPGPDSLMFNEKVLISGSTNALPNTVATMNSDNDLEFGSGSATPSAFVVRHEPGSGDSDNECVQWHDKIWLAFTTESHNTSNCGWYGCRVARMSDALTMEFGHGTTGQSFYVRPKGSTASSGSECVSYGDEVFLAFSAQLQKTRKCGWYGCRVLHYAANSLGIFGRGGSAQQAGGIYFTKG